LRKTLKLCLVQTKAEGRKFNGGKGKEIDGSVEILIIICLVQRRGQNGMNFNCIYVRFKLKREGKYFKTKLPFYRYFNTIRVL